MAMDLGGSTQFNGDGFPPKQNAADLNPLEYWIFPGHPPGRWQGEVLGQKQDLPDGTRMARPRWTSPGW